MKTTRIILLTALFAGAGMLVESLSGVNTVMSNGGGAPESAACTSCHFGAAVNADANGSASVSITGNPTYYVPGHTYEVKITGTYPGRTKFGFTLEAEDNNASAAGQFFLTGGSGAQKVGTYVTHTASGTGTTGGTKTWTLNWTAPSSNAGTITFKVFVNATNNDGSTNGDRIFSASKSLSFAPTSAGPELTNNSTQLYPQPATSSVQITHPEMSGKFVHLDLFTLTGKRVVTLANEMATANTLQLPLSAFAPGIYLVNGTIGNQPFCHKLVIQ